MSVNLARRAWPRVRLQVLSAPDVLMERTLTTRVCNIAKPVILVLIPNIKVSPAHPFVLLARIFHGQRV